MWSRIVFWSDREKPLFLTPTGKTLTSRKAVLAAMEVIGGYSQVIKMMAWWFSWEVWGISMSSNVKHILPYRRTLRKWKRVPTSGRRSQTTSGCKPRRKENGSFFPRHCLYYISFFFTGKAKVQLARWRKQRVRKRLQTGERRNQRRKRARQRQRRGKQNQEHLGVSQGHWLNWQNSKCASYHRKFHLPIISKGMWVTWMGRGERSCATAMSTWILLPSQRQRKRWFSSSLVE